MIRLPEARVSDPPLASSRAAPRDLCHGAADSQDPSLLLGVTVTSPFVRNTDALGHQLTCGAVAIAMIAGRARQLSLP